MKIKQTIKHLALLLFVSVSIFISFIPDTASAVGNNGCETDTAIIKCTNVDDSGKPENTGVWSLLLLVINIMTAGIGVLAIAGIVYGSILYTSAGDSAEKTKKAKDVIRNVVLGILAYALMYSFLNFIIPGGLFK